MERLSKERDTFRDKLLIMHGRMEEMSRRLLYETERSDRAVASARRQPADDDITIFGKDRPRKLGSVIAEYLQGRLGPPS